MVLCAVGLTCGFAQNAGAPGGLVVGTEALVQSGNQVFTPAGIGPQQLGWIVNFQQAAGRAGVFTFTVDSATDGTAWRNGNNLVAWRNAPLFGGQAGLLAGTLDVPTDLLALHFTNLYTPNLSLSGGEFTFRRDGLELTAFGGRNLISEGPYIPFFTSAPDFIVGTALRLPAWHNLQFEARYLHTQASLAASPVLSGQLNPIPRVSNEFFLDGTWHMANSSDWLNEVAMSHAAPAGAGATSLSLISGPMISRPAYDLQAYVVRQGSDYFPVSNQVLGDREGGYVGADFRPARRWDFSATATDLRNNVQNNPAVPTLDAMSEGGAATYAPGNGFSMTGNLSQTSINSLAGANTAVKLTMAQVQGLRNYGNNQTLLRFQDWITHAAGRAGAQSAIKTEEIEQQRNFGGSTVSAGFGMQESGGATATALAMHLNVGANLNLGRHVSFYASGEIGRDLRDQSAMSLTTIRTVVMQLQAHLPHQMELSGQFVHNSVVSQLNPQRIFIAGLGDGPVLLLPGTSQQMVFVRLTKNFRWGAHVPLLMGVSEDVAARLIPAYGTVAGLVFDDRNQDGQRGAGDEGLGGVEVSLAGRTAMTDSRGHFEFHGVRTGEYTLDVDVDHLPVRYTAPARTAIPVVVRSSGTPLIQIPLQVAGAITGRVLISADNRDSQANAASAGAPGLAGAALRLLPGNQLAFTDAQGGFHFDSVPPGRYRLQVLADSLPADARMDRGGAAPVTVTSGGTVNGLTFRIRIATPSRAIETVVEPAQQIALPVAGSSQPRPAPAGAAPLHAKPQRHATPLGTAKTRPQGRRRARRHHIGRRRLSPGRSVAPVRKPRAAAHPAVHTAHRPARQRLNRAARVSAPSQNAAPRKSRLAAPSRRLSPAYQTRQALLPGFIAVAGPQWKAAAKSGSFWTAPFTRKRPGEWGSTVAINRAICGRVFWHQIWP